MKNLFVLLGILVLATGCATWQKMRLVGKDNPLPPSEQNRQAGQLLYTKHCQSCHGLTGLGDGPAAPQGTGILNPLRDAKDGVFVYYILHGKNEAMPAFASQGVSETQGFQIIHYVRSLGEN